MRSNGARMAMVVIASVLTTGIAAGQQYQPSASLLRYPLPQSPAAYYSAKPIQHPYAVAQMPAAMPAPAYNQASNYGPSYYYASPPAVPTVAAPPPGSYANQVYPPTYAAQQLRPSPPTADGRPRRSPRRLYLTTRLQPPRPLIPGLFGGRATALHGCPGTASILVQSTAPPEPVPPQSYAEPSPSDSHYAQPQAAPYYYADPRQAPGLSADGWPAAPIAQLRPRLSRLRWLGHGFSVSGGCPLRNV